MKWCLGLWIACLWACNPINEVQISGDLFHYKGGKLYFEICGQDTTITVALDSMGSFEAVLPMLPGLRFVPEAVPAPGEVLHSADQD